MRNPFEDVKVRPEAEIGGSGVEASQKTAKKDELYKKYDPIVKEVLQLFITAHGQDIWVQDSDCTRRYCCHIAWFIGPKEKYSDPYDLHHTIRRRIEVKLDLDGLCNPTGFTVTNFEAVEKTIQVGLEKENLIAGIKEVVK